MLSPQPALRQMPPDQIAPRAVRLNCDSIRKDRISGGGRPVDSEFESGRHAGNGWESAGLIARGR